LVITDNTIVNIGLENPKYTNRFVMDTIRQGLDKVTLSVVALTDTDWDDIQWKVNGIPLIEYNGLTSITVSPKETSTYKVEIVNAIGCDFSHDTVIHVMQLPRIVLPPALQDLCESTDPTWFNVDIEGNAADEELNIQWYRQDSATGVAYPIANTAVGNATKFYTQSNLSPYYGSFRDTLFIGGYYDSLNQDPNGIFMDSIRYSDNGSLYYMTVQSDIPGLTAVVESEKAELLVSRREVPTVWLDYVSVNNSRYVNSTSSYWGALTETEVQEDNRTAHNIVNFPDTVERDDQVRLQLDGRYWSLYNNAGSYTWYWKRNGKWDTIVSGAGLDNVILPNDERLPYDTVMCVVETVLSCVWTKTDTTYPIVFVTRPAAPPIVSSVSAICEAGNYNLSIIPSINNLGDTFDIQWYRQKGSNTPEILMNSGSIISKYYGVYSDTLFVGGYYDRLNYHPLAENADHYLDSVRYADDADVVYFAVITSQITGISTKSENISVEISERQVPKVWLDHIMLNDDYHYQGMPGEVWEGASITASDNEDIRR
jgi:hypothetical protein